MERSSTVEKKCYVIWAKAEEKRQKSLNALPNCQLPGSTSGRESFIYQNRAYGWVVQVSTTAYFI